LILGPHQKALAQSRLWARAFCFLKKELNKSSKRKVEKKEISTGENLNQHLTEAIR